MCMQGISEKGSKTDLNALNGPTGKVQRKRHL